MSSCKSKGVHYTVKDARNGFACLLCGLAGDLDMMKSNRCEACEAPATKLDFQEAKGEVRGSTRAAQEAMDRKMAWELQHLNNLRELEIQEAELRELHKQETEIEQLLTLQELEHEEMLLQALLNEQRALALAEQVSHARDLEARSSSHPEGEDPAAAPIELKATQVEGPKADECLVPPETVMRHPVELYGYGYLTACRNATHA